MMKKYSSFFILLLGGLIFSSFPSFAVSIEERSDGVTVYANGKVIIASENEPILVQDGNKIITVEENSFVTVERDSLQYLAQDEGAVSVNILEGTRSGSNVQGDHIKMEIIKGSNKVLIDKNEVFYFLNGKYYRVQGGMVHESNYSSSAPSSAVGPKVKKIQEDIWQEFKEEPKEDPEVERLRRELEAEREKNTSAPAQVAYPITVNSPPVPPEEPKGTVHFEAVIPENFQRNLILNITSEQGEHEQVVLSPENQYIHSLSMKKGTHTVENILLDYEGDQYDITFDKVILMPQIADIDYKFEVTPIQKEDTSEEEDLMALLEAEEKPEVQETSAEAEEVPKEQKKKFLYLGGGILTFIIFMIAKFKDKVLYKDQ